MIAVVSSLEATNISVTVTVFLAALCGNLLLQCNPVSLQDFIYSEYVTISLQWVTEVLPQKANMQK